MKAKADPLVVSTPNKIRASDLEMWLPAFGKRFGVAKLERPLSMDFYDQWLALGYHGEMSYLERHRSLKASPSTWLPFARSAIVFALDYGHRKSRNESDYVTLKPMGLRTARYLEYSPNNEDYHDAIRLELEPILKELSLRYPEAEFRLSVDAEPVLERDLATRAGLGWVGKNTCVIDRKSGSLFFIAEILTSLETDAAAMEPLDFCGTCTRCLDACPTSALLKPKLLDATKCISYWTIESKKIPPKELREKFGDWFFGCDICQTVCPWNVKTHGAEAMTDRASDPATMLLELREILSSSNRELERKFQGTPLSRARGFGLKRNALIIAGNARLKELLPDVEALLEDKKLGTLAAEIKSLLI